MKTEIHTHTHTHAQRTIRRVCEWKKDREGEEQERGKEEKTKRNDVMKPSE